MSNGPDPVDLVRLAADFRRHAGSREREVRERWGLNYTHFAMLVNAALDDPAVALAAPSEVARLRRLRTSRQVQRRAG